VEFDQMLKPVILDNFKTNITKYDCSAETVEKGGINIPAVVVPEEETPVVEHYPSYGEEVTNG
jgi:hypothetical protein